MPTITPSLTERTPPVEWDDSIEFGAAGGVVSTAKDMGVWMKMLLASDMSSEYALLSPETRADIFADSMVAEVSFSETAADQRGNRFQLRAWLGRFPAQRACRG